MRAMTGSLLCGSPDDAYCNPRQIALSPFQWHQADVRHVIMQYFLLTSTVPLNGYAGPILVSDGAKISCRVPPANAVTCFEKS
jgi:hypothetical protein